MMDVFCFMPHELHAKLRFICKCTQPQIKQYIDHVLCVQEEVTHFI